MKKTKHRLFSLILAIVFCIAMPCSAMAAETEASDYIYPQMSTYATSTPSLTDTYRMATYYGTNFYTGTTEKTVYLENFCAEVVFRCTTENNVLDYVYVHITDIDGNGAYNKVLSFRADDTSYWQTLYLPAGNYKIRFSGDALINHTHAAINFYAYNP